MKKTRDFFTISIFLWFMGTTYSMFFSSSSRRHVSHTPSNAKPKNDGVSVAVEHVVPELVKKPVSTSVTKGTVIDRTIVGALSVAASDRTMTHDGKTTTSDQTTVVAESPISTSTFTAMSDRKSSVIAEKSLSTTDWPQSATEWPQSGWAATGPTVVSPDVLLQQLHVPLNDAAHLPLWNPTQDGGLYVGDIDVDTLVEQFWKYAHILDVNARWQPRVVKPVIRIGVVDGRQPMYFGDVCGRRLGMKIQNQKLYGFGKYNETAHKSAQNIIAWLREETARPQADTRLSIRCHRQIEEGVTADHQTVTLYVSENDTTDDVLKRLERLFQSRLCTHHTALFRCSCCLLVPFR